MTYHEDIIWIDPRDKPGLLHAVMEECASGSLISFEGSLESLGFINWPEISREETDSLKRQTLSPNLDFVVVQLNESTFPSIWEELAEKDHLVNEGIIHVQIEKDGKLVFGGYDNFHKECTVAYAGIPVELIDKLQEKGIIRGYKQSNS